MASTSNPLEEILNSDVADSPFSALVRPIETSVSPSTGRDASTNVLTSGDRSNHLFGSSVTAPPMTVGHSSNGSDTRTYPALPSSAIQSAILQNNHTITVDVTGGGTKVFNNGVTAPQFAVPQAVTSVARATLNSQVKTELDLSSRNSQTTSDQLTAVKAFPVAQTVMMTVANPVAASLAQTLGNYLNAAKFNQPTTTLTNIATSGLSNTSLDPKPNSTEQKPLVVANVGSNLVVPAQVISQLQTPQHVVSNASMAQIKTEVTQAAATIKPFTVAGQQTLATGQQNVTVIQSTLPQGAVGFPQPVQIVSMPPQNVQRAPIAPVSTLRTLAPRVTLSQAVRIPQQQMIRPQGVMASSIFTQGVQQNIISGNMVVVKNERGQVMFFQSPQPASISNSEVIQSVQPSPTTVRPTIAGTIGLVQSPQPGQGFIPVSSSQAQFLQPQMTATLRIPSSTQNIIHMQQTPQHHQQQQQQQQQTTLHSTALSTPSIVSRLTKPSNIAQTNATTHTSTSTAASVVTTPNIKDLQSNVLKCKNFLSTLMKLASNQPEEVVNNVKNLIQGLIDGNVEPEDFTNQLQKELKSSPQPYLVPFLRENLPFLRQSLYNNKLTIDGIRPPSASVAGIGVPQTITSPAVPIFSTATTIAGIRQRPAAPNAVTSKPFVPTPQLTPQQQQQIRLAMIQNSLKMAGVRQPQQQQTVNHTKNLLTRPTMLTMPTAVGTGQTSTGLVVSATATSNGLLPQINTSTTAPHKGEKRKYEAIRDDDDINDVATMGGVNLTEESRNILATNSELVSGQLRSCKDEKFLDTQLLMQRVNNIAQRRGLDSAAPEVAGLISHAMQDHLRTMIEQLSLYVTHRLENYRSDPRFEQANDRRAQLKFLEELGSLERKRHEEAERGVLMRAAKSRAKVEDPEQAKLKEKAKAMQQAEMEELRHREANLTALAAIGPRKPRTIQGASGSNDSGSSVNKTIVPMRPRIKRVNLRDLLFLMEQRRETRRSPMLYKAFLK